MIAKSALFIADEIGADHIILFTNSWFLARVVSAFKPNQPVFAFTKDTNVLRSMNILFAIKPFLIWEWSNYPMEDEKNAIEILKKNWLLTKGQKIVVINDIAHWESIAPYTKVINL
jgi:pyruvate kinase